MCVCSVASTTNHTARHDDVITEVDDDVGATILSLFNLRVDRHCRTTAAAVRRTR